MAGIKKNNKNHKSLIAENRFKKHSKKSSPKKLPTNSSSKFIRTSGTKFLIQFIQRISRFFFTVNLGVYLALKLNCNYRHKLRGKLLLFRYERI